MKFHSISSHCAYLMGVLIEWILARLWPLILSSGGNKGKKIIEKAHKPNIVRITPQKLLVWFHPNFTGMTSTEFNCAFLRYVTVHWFFTLLWSLFLKFVRTISFILLMEFEWNVTGMIDSMFNVFLWNNIWQSYGPWTKKMSFCGTGIDYLTNKQTNKQTNITLDHCDRNRSLTQFYGNKKSEQFKIWNAIYTDFHTKFTKGCLTYRDVGTTIWKYIIIYNTANKFPAIWLV